MGIAPGGLYTGTGEFVPKTAHWTTWHEDEARYFWLYEHMFPEASWLGGRIAVWSRQYGHPATGRWLPLDQRRLSTSKGTHQLSSPSINLAFAGWRAWVDDRPVPATPAPWIETQAIQPGFLLVEVPPG